jgi:hypothetical protein
MKKVFVKIALFFLLLLQCAISSNAQPTKFFIKANVQFPKAIGNKFFRTYYTGIYNLDVSANYLLYKNMYAGFGVDYKRFQLSNNYTSIRKTYIENKKKIAISSSALSGLVNIGYWKTDATSSLVVDYNLGVGLTQTTIISPIDTFNNSVTKALTVQPRVGFYWYVDDDKLMMLGGTIGYSYVNTKFDANALHYNLLSLDYSERDLRLKTQYISFGLGLIYRIGKSTGASTDFD